MPSEAVIQRAIQVACSDGVTRLWRIQVGNFLLADGRRVISGTPGMSDLQGLRCVTVTPAMVGQRIAVYCAIEVKRDADARRTPEQHAFIAAVQSLGGRAGFACSIADARAILDVP